MKINEYDAPYWMGATSTMKPHKTRLSTVFVDLSTVYRGANEKGEHMNEEAITKLLNTLSSISTSLSRIAVSLDGIAESLDGCKVETSKGCALSVIGDIFTH